MTGLIAIIVHPLRRLIHPAANLSAWRAVFAVAISAALAVSLMQAPCCDGRAAEGLAATITIAATTTDNGATDVFVGETADLPAQKAPHTPAMHCDHCLVHIAFQAWGDAVTSRAEFGGVTVTLPNDTAPASVAGLPLFKPPRA